MENLSFVWLLRRSFNPWRDEQLQTNLLGAEEVPQ